MLAFKQHKNALARPHAQAAAALPATEQRPLAATRLGGSAAPTPRLRRRAGESGFPKSERHWGNLGGREFKVGIARVLGNAFCGFRLGPRPRAPGRVQLKRKNSCPILKGCLKLYGYSTIPYLKALILYKTLKAFEKGDF